jgi:hypothetical protein
LSIFLSEPVHSESTTITFLPWSNKCSTRWEPMNPAPYWTLANAPQQLSSSLRVFTPVTITDMASSCCSGKLIQYSLRLEPINFSIEKLKE